MKFIVLAVSLLLAFSAPYALAQDGFSAFLDGVRAQARAEGISQPTIDAALSGIGFKSKIIDLDRKQPEGKLSFGQYYNNVVNTDRIKKGRALYAQHRELLERVGKQYGVQPQFIVALWGIETSYGNNTGGFGVVEALATLAYDGRRSEFFRSELMNALKILDQGHISPAAMKGSWAGAMGQNQFMPSSFFNFAVDDNGDGKRDIWTSLPDVFASTANYLGKSGWRGDERWGRAVSLPAGFSKSLMDGKTKKSLREWAALGVTLPGGEALPVAEGFTAGIAAPDGVDGRAFLVYNNFDTTLKWNRSTYFALSVGLLADAIASAGQ